MTILATIIVLGVLIFVHELGHFWAAKAVGVEVQRFSIGLGPRVTGFQRGETEYVLSLIPLGGYVKMGGMDDEVMDRIEGGEGGPPLREPSDRDFDAKPIWARAFVISAGVIMNMIFAFGVYTFLAARYGVTDLDTTKIGYVETATLPPGTAALASLLPGSEFVSIGGEQVETWDEVMRALRDADPGPLVIETASPAAELQVEVPSASTDRQLMATSVQMWFDTEIGVLEPGGAAAAAGIRVGDRLTAVAGVPVTDWYELREELSTRPGQTVEIAFVRDGAEEVGSMTLADVEESGPDGNVLRVGRAGIGPAAFRDVTLLLAVRQGYQDTVVYTGYILGFLRDLVTGNVSPRSVGSIVTIGEISGQAAAAGLPTFLAFMALFSINLAILNLLPIPVLDGGHLVFLSIEAIRGGRALSIEQRVRWSNVGFVILMGIMLWALSNDVLRLLGL
jgi:regulator of sigma E protease